MLHSLPLHVVLSSSCMLLYRGRQASKDENMEKPEPFYRLSVSKQKTSSEIINEARSVLRTLRTQRPFTPAEDQRKLFGSGSSRAPQNRPPSVFRYCDFKIFQTSFSTTIWICNYVSGDFSLVLICIPNHILCLLIMMLTVGVNLHVLEVPVD